MGGFARGLILAVVGLFMLLEPRRSFRNGAVSWTYFPWSDVKFYRDRQPIRFGIYVFVGLALGALMFVVGLAMMLGLMPPFTAH
jgi:hypothetical protein